MMLHKPIGLLGGTFDPIHEGHIGIAKILMQTCSLKKIEFVPCYQPAHRHQPLASAVDRLAMVKLAIANVPYFSVNEYEIVEKKISYTIDTVTYLRDQFPDQPFCWIVGSDAFSAFHQWHEWQKIPEKVHIIVVSRSATPTFPPEVMALLKQREITNPHLLQETVAGKIYSQAIEPVICSATQIRHDIRAQLKSIAGLDPSVLNYIQKHGLYQ